MKSDNDTPPTAPAPDGSDEKPAEQTSSPEVQEAPADALSRTPDDLADEAAEKQAEADKAAAAEKDKSPSKFKQFLRKVNLYFLLFLLIVAIAGIIAVVNYLNSQKTAPSPDFGTQEMSQEDLKQLANKDVSVGGISQTLTIQGNAVIEGQSLMRGDLNVAGNIQTAGKLQAAELTVSSQSNLGETQINNLQVASNTAIQGNTTLRDLNVAGSASFKGAVTAAEITVTRLIMSGNASLQVPNHISFPGPAPNRTINGGVLGNGGSASVNGSDTSGTVNINTGNNPTAGCFVRLNFAQSFSNQPHVIISPIGEAAGRTQYYVDRSQAGFSICASSPAPANQSFAFDYFVTN